MITFFYIILTLVIWHYFYDSVISPSLRHGLRYNFFSLRDKLRNIKIENELSSNDDKIFGILDNSISHMISSMSFINYANYLIIKKRYNENTLIKKELKEINQIMSNAENNELIEIDRNMNKLGARALIYNHGALLPYILIFLIPILLFLFFTIQFDRLTKLIIKVSSSLVYSSSEIDDNSHISLA